MDRNQEKTMKPERISKYEFENRLKRESPQIFGRKTPTFRRRKMEKDFQERIFGSSPFASKRELENIASGLERNKRKTGDEERRISIQNKINFLKRFTGKRD